MRKRRKFPRGIAICAIVSLLSTQVSSAGGLVIASSLSKGLRASSNDSSLTTELLATAQLQWQVIGTTVQEFEYDGLSRMTRSFDNNEPEDTGDDATITYAYDSLSRLLEEVQNGHAISSRWMGDNNRIGLIYPNGRELEITFDKLDRIDRISDDGPLTMRNRSIVDYDYIGPGRVLERTYSNGVRLTYLDDARQQDVGYDGLRRVVLHRHLRQDNSLVAGFAYDYDRANNKLSERWQHASSLGETYAYDSIYRLVRWEQMEALDKGTEKTWQLDGVNNWASVTKALITIAGKGQPLICTNQPNNMNEYTIFSHHEDASRCLPTPQLYDDNGNLIDDGTNRYQYDFANRLRRVIRKSDNAEIAIYRYDAHNRRNERIVMNTTSFDDRVRYLYDGWQEFEERRANSTQQYVYGVWIDEPLTLDKDINNDGVIDQTFFYQQDAKTHVAALTNATGGVVDRVTYDAYGQASALASLVDNPYFFASRRYDSEVEAYYYRMRYYRTGSGRFVQRDPALSMDLQRNLGSPYAYVGNDPVNTVDPSGLWGMLAGDTGYYTDPSPPPGGAVGRAPGDPRAPANTVALFWAGVYGPQKGNRCCQDQNNTIQFWLTINPNNNSTTSEMLKLYAENRSLWMETNCSRGWSGRPQGVISGSYLQRAQLHNPNGDLNEVFFGVRQDLPLCSDPNCSNGDCADIEFSCTSTVYCLQGNPAQRVEAAEIDWSVEIRGAGRCCEYQSSKATVRVRIIGRCRA